MFERSELVAGWRALTGGAAPPLEVVEFGNSDFTSLGSEQHIRAVRGARTDFAGGLQFWINAMESIDWYNGEPYFTAYAEAALCEPIACEEFAYVVKAFSCSLLPPLPGFVQDLVGWKSGLRMYGEWNNVAVIAELAASYVLFTWSTSA